MAAAGGRRASAEVTFWPYAIDWSATGSFWTGLGTLALGATAWRAATAWKKQERARRLSTAANQTIVILIETSDFIENAKRQWDRIAKPILTSQSELTIEHLRLLQSLSAGTTHQAAKLKPKWSEARALAYSIGVVTDFDAAPTLQVLTLADVWERASDFGSAKLAELIFEYERGSVDSADLESIRTIFAPMVGETADTAVEYMQKARAYAENSLREFIVI